MASPVLGLEDMDAAQAGKEATYNGDRDALDNSLGGLLSKAMADANQTLTVTPLQDNESLYMFYLLTGALTAGRNLVVPTRTKLFLVKNNTTGGFAVTVKTSGGAGVAVAAGSQKLLYCDGTDVVAIV